MSRLGDVESELVEHRNRGQAVVLATVVRTGGRPPSQAGEKILLGADGNGLAGTLGCSEFDSAARADAPAILAAGVPAVRTYTHDLGNIEVYLEPYPARPLLLVLGSTPVAQALLRWAPEVGFAVCDSVTQAVTAGEELYAVHTDHDAPGIVEDLAEVLSRRPRFVGVMGSRRHTGEHLEELRRRGLDSAAVEAIQSPVGLDLGGRSATEIALSILAGVVAVRHGGRGGWKAAPPA